MPLGLLQGGEVGVGWGGPRAVYCGIGEDTDDE